MVTEILTPGGLGIINCGVAVKKERVADVDRIARCQLD